jgi:hypothetical protein
MNEGIVKLRDLLAKVLDVRVVNRHPFSAVF